MKTFAEVKVNQTFRYLGSPYLMVKVSETTARLSPYGAFPVVVPPHTPVVT
jgi:hypothetical protein